MRGRVREPWLVARTALLILDEITNEPLDLRASSTVVWTKGVSCLMMLATRPLSLEAPPYWGLAWVRPLPEAKSKPKTLAVKGFIFGFGYLSWVSATSQCVQRMLCD